MRLINQILKALLKLKGDRITNIARILFTGGITLIIAGGASYTINVTNSSGNEVFLSFTKNEISIYVLVLGCLITLLGVFLLYRRYSGITKLGSTRDVALIYAPGFSNQDPTPSKNIMRIIGTSRIKEVVFDVFDSYKPDLIINEYDYQSQQISKRVGHKETEEAFVAAIGSIPYLYLLGTMLRDGHTKPHILEFMRGENEWETLQHFGKKEEIIIADEFMDVETKINDLKPTLGGDIGLAIAFTFPIYLDTLPKDLRPHTLRLTLKSGTKKEALMSESIQAEIVTELQHIISRLFQKAERVHLFIATQLSVAINLGRLYQNGTMGEVIVHCYDPKKKKYQWALSFDHDTVEIYSSKHNQTASL